MTELFDRDLDAWLAEHLLGFKRDRAGALFKHFEGPTWSGKDYLVPESSSTGDGMLLILEAMRERGWVGLVKWDGDREHDHYTALFSQPDNVARIDAHSLPRAVAEAAKAALEAAAVAHL